MSPISKDRVVKMQQSAQAEPGRPSPRVLVVGPGVKSRGGIASVLRIHMEMPVWREMHCALLSTHDDTNAYRKVCAALSAYVRAPFEIRKADIIHIHLAGQLSLLRKLPIATVALLSKKPFIAHMHASSPESLFDATPAWAVRYMLGRSARVIALSQSWADLIRDRVPAANVHIIPNPVRNASVGDQNLDRRPIVLFAGKLEPRKGYMTLLAAAPRILERHPHVQFWFAGHGELKAAQAKATRLGISASVRLLGWKTPDEINRLYHQASVFCLPSHNEGVPMSVLEAMSCGTPVVCTPVGGLGEIIEDGQNGLFAAVGSSASTAENILRLLDAPAYAREIGAAGRRTVQRLCGFERVGETLRQTYLSLSPEPLGTRAEKAH